MVYIAITSLVPFCIFKEHPTGAGEMTQHVKYFLASMITEVWFSETNKQTNNQGEKKRWAKVDREASVGRQKWGKPGTHWPGSPVYVASPRPVRNTVSSERCIVFLRSNTWGCPLDSNAHTLACLLTDTHTHIYTCPWTHNLHSHTS